MDKFNSEAEEVCCVEVREDIWEGREVIREYYDVRRWKGYVDLRARRARHVKIWLSESG